MDTRKGEQHSPEFLSVNPNGKVPVIVDQETGATVFDSNAILLSRREDRSVLPENTPAARASSSPGLCSWRQGLVPSRVKQYFKHYAPEPKEYAVTRYLFEAKRHYSILDARLSERRYLLGDTYTIVDMAAWGWARMVPFILGEDACKSFPNLKRLLDEISARPAAQRAATLKERHTFKTEMDEEARRHMFRHLSQQVM